MAGITQGVAELLQPFSAHEARYEAFRAAGAAGEFGALDVLAISTARVPIVKISSADKRAARTTTLGEFPSPFPDSNDPFCTVKNHQRERTLPRLTAAPTATSSAYF